MTPTTVLTMIKPIFAGQLREVARLAGEAVVAPGAFGWLAGTLFNSFGFGSWAGAAAGTVAGLIFMIARNHYSERRDMWNRFDKIIKDQDERNAARLTEEQNTRHELANQLNRANLAMFHVMQSFTPDGVDRESLSRAISIYTQAPKSKDGP